MKLVINFDLLNRIKDTQKEFRLQRVFQNSLNDASKLCLIWHPIFLVLNLFDKYNILEMIIEGIESALLYYFLYMPANYFNSKKYQDIFEEELQELSIDLGKIYVNTSKDLLKESKLYHTEYELKLTDKKLPYILQKKYINIPTYDNGDIRDTSVLQEHKLLSKKYYLSRGSVNKGYARQYCRN